VNWLRDWHLWLRENRSRLADSAVVCAVATVALLLGPSRWLNLSALSDAWRQAAIVAARSALYLVLPLLSLFLLRLKPSEVGFAPGRPRRWLVDVAVLYALMLPVLVIAATRPEFQRAYPYLRLSREGGTLLLAGSGVLAFYMLGWEFIFRGYMLFALHRRIGIVAVAVQMVPFALLHSGKPLPEALGSVVAGLVLGLVALRGGSFLPALILHYAVALTMDVLALLFR